MFHRVHPRRLLVSPYRIEPWLNGASRYVGSLSPSFVNVTNLYILQLASPWTSILGACARHAGCTPWLQSTDIDSRHSAPRSPLPQHLQLLCYLQPRQLMNIDEHIMMLRDLLPSTNNPMASYAYPVGQPSYLLTSTCLI